MSVVDTWNWDKVKAEEEDYEVTADEKVRHALWNFECAMGIRPNRIIMGCNLADELRRMYLCNTVSEKIVCEYEGIPVTVNYENPNMLEVGYAMKLWY